MSQRDSGEKLCSKCRKEVPASREFFHADRQKPDGLRPDCMACAQVRRREVYMRRREKEIAQTRRYEKEHWNRLLEHNRNRRHSNPDVREKLRLKAAEYKDRNSELVKKRNRDWAKRNPGKNAAKAALARAKRRRAVPPWLTNDHLTEMRRLYIEAAAIGHHVDHIHPICGATCSGLHVPWNLQILPPLENLKKGNRYVAA